MSLDVAYKNVFKDFGQGPDTARFHITWGVLQHVIGDVILDRPINGKREGVVGRPQIFIMVQFTLPSVYATVPERKQLRALPMPNVCTRCITCTTTFC